MESTAFSHLYRNEEDRGGVCHNHHQRNTGNRKQTTPPRGLAQEAIIVGVGGEWRGGFVLSDAWTSDFVGGQRGDISLWALSSQSG